MPFEGSRGNPQKHELWAPIIDIPNGWVNVGPSSDSCKLYNSIHPHPPLWGLIGRHHREDVEFDEENVKAMTTHIMCCREPSEGDGTAALQTTLPRPVSVANTKYEQDILDNKHPVWFSRKHGYHGTTHEEAVAFCENVGNMVLCPTETYCPKGNDDPERPLFMQNRAFESEQWAPVATSSGSNEKWVLIGKLDGEYHGTCRTFGELKGMKPWGWDPDDGDPDSKHHVMCCLDPVHLPKETNFAKNLNLIWLDESFGWNGGSHDDAKEFCSKLGVKKRLCPYAAYCPHGPGKPVIGGHSEDFNGGGEQWAPAELRDTNYWVMIGQKYQNSATTCMDNWELEGRVPSWGASKERADLKRHIMCCEF